MSHLLYTHASHSLSFRCKYDTPQEAYISPQGQYPKKDANRRISVNKQSPFGIELVKAMNSALKTMEVQPNGELKRWSLQGDFAHFVMGKGLVFDCVYDEEAGTVSDLEKVPLARLFTNDKIRVLSLTAHAEAYPAKYDEDKCLVYASGVHCKADRLLIARESASPVTAEDFGFASGSDLHTTVKKRVSFADPPAAGKSIRKVTKMKQAARRHDPQQHIVTTVPDDDDDDDY